ncbi:MAG: SPOR domain-containing protein [Maritimibacter sp.]
MKKISCLGALTVLAILQTGTASAYTLDQAGKPAEMPPANYRGDSYIDSRGCAYGRIEVGNYVNWVPRISADRKSVICGLPPTDVSAVTGRLLAPPPPPPPGEVMTAAPQDAGGSDNVSAAEIASFADGPAADMAPASAPASVPASAPAAPRAPDVVRTVRVTCTGDGGDVRVKVGLDNVGIACPADQSAPIRYLVHHGNGETSRVIASPAPAQTPPAAVPVEAPQPVVVAVAPTVVATPTVVAPTAAPAAPQSTERVRYGGVPVGSGTGNNFGSGYKTGSSPAPMDPIPSAGQVATLMVTGGVVTGSPSSAPTGNTTYPVGSGYGVTSYPGAADPVPAIPEGYRAAWNDGRLNPNRGPRSAVGDAQMAAVWDTSQVPMRRAAPVATARSAPTVVSSMGSATASAAPQAPATRAAASAPAASDLRYVQVGAFRVAENAAAVAAKLQGLGLPGRVAKTRSGLNVVVAGPYSDAGALRDALSVARRGFPQAYLR